MVIGLVPVGGKAKRLDIPFSKEMLPQIGFNYYNPVINNCVTHMINAGVDQIVFVHGNNYKREIVNFYSSSTFVHITQKTSSPLLVFRDFLSFINFDPNTKILYGLPDSITFENPYLKMLDKKGVVCALFTGSDRLQVDRLTNFNKFDIKSSKNKLNQSWFWGAIKFDYSDLLSIVSSIEFNVCTDIGELLNYNPFNTVRLGQYFDLGTWEGYNEYVKSAIK